MFETQLTLVGTALSAPQMRRTTESSQVVASFRVASTSRRWDKNNQEWIDGHSLRVRVTCWRRLAEGVVQSVNAGDPVIVVGRLYTRDWIDEQGNHRVLYELDATAVGHDLTRGTADFKRHQANLSISTIEDEEAERRIGGEDSVPAEPKPASDLPAVGSASEVLDGDSDGMDDDFDDVEEDRRVLVPA